VTRRPTAARATFAPVKLAIAGALALLAVLVPFIYPSPYGTGVMVTIAILVVLNASWNFLLGVAGVWNFGQLALYAAGGYGCGVLMVHASFPPLLGLLGGIVAGALLAVLLAFPTLRLYGIYTSLLTFAAAQVVQLVIQNDDTGTTGGAFGLPSVHGLFGSLSPLWNVRAYYWLYLVIAIVVVAGLAWLVRTPYGLAIRTTRDSLAYGSARGIDPLRYRVSAFALSGAIAGLAGGMYTVYNGSIAPNVMGLTPMSIYVTMIVVGGLGTVSGPIIGTILVTIVQQALIDHPGTQLTVLGAILLVIVIFFPRGIADEAAKVQRRVVAWMDEEEDVDDIELDRPGPPQLVTQPGA
jgi:ABC-type branched-subunit amino acid transport system permease subunit